jgi:hypothetical protein
MLYGDVRYQRFHVLFGDRLADGGAFAADLLVTHREVAAHYARGLVIRYGLQPVRLSEHVPGSITLR